jgi:hypothetical protein
LPDGLLPNPKSQILANFGGLYIDGKMLIYFMAIRNITMTFGIFYDHFLHFVFSGYIFSGFGFMYQEKSGNPVADILPRCTYPGTTTTKAATKIFIEK